MIKRSAINEISKELDNPKDTPRINIRNQKADNILPSYALQNAYNEMGNNLVDYMSMHESGTALNEIEKQTMTKYFVNSGLYDDEDFVYNNLGAIIKQHTGVDIDKGWYRAWEDAGSVWDLSKKYSDNWNKMKRLDTNSQEYKDRMEYSEKLRRAMAIRGTTFKNYGWLGNTMIEDADLTSQLLEQALAGASMVAATAGLAWAAGGVLGMASGTGFLTGGSNMLNAAYGGTVMAKGAQTGLALTAAGTPYAVGAGSASAASRIMTVLPRIKIAELSYYEAGSKAAELAEMTDSEGNHLTQNQIAFFSDLYGAAIFAIENEMINIIHPLAAKLGVSGALEETAKKLESLFEGSLMGMAGGYIYEQLGESVQEIGEDATSTIIDHFAKSVSDWLNGTKFAEDENSLISDLIQDGLNGIKQYPKSFITAGAIPGIVGTGGMRLAMSNIVKPSIQKDLKATSQENFTFEAVRDGKLIDVSDIDTMGAWRSAPVEGETKAEKHDLIPMIYIKDTGMYLPLHSEDRQWIANYSVSDERAHGVMAKVVYTDTAGFADEIIRLTEEDDNYEPNTELTEKDETAEPQTAVEREEAPAKNQLDSDAVNAVAREFESVLRDDGLDVLGMENGTVYVNSQDSIEEARQAAEAYGLLTVPTRDGIRVYGGARDKAFAFTVRTATPETRITDNRYIPISERDTSKLSDVEYKREQAIEYAFNSIKAQLGDVRDSIVHGGAIQTNILSETMGIPVDEILDKGIVMFQTAKNDDIASYLKGYNAAHPDAQITKDDIKGWMTPGKVTDETGKTREIYVVNVTNTADETTLLHEVGHVMRAMATPEMLSGFVGLQVDANRKFTGEAGAMWRSDIREENGKYYLGDKEYDTKKEAVEAIRDNEELFVDLLLEYEKTGNVPNTEVKNFFDKVIDFLKRAYRYIQKQLSPKAKAAFDTFFSTKTFEQLNETENMTNKEWREWNRQMDQRINDDMATEDTPVFQIGETLLAPNGQPSKLSPRLWNIVRTPAFKNYFGDWENDPQNASKVVDENGDPLKVYHGTTTPGFTQFDTEGKANGGEGNLIFFTDNPKIASRFAMETRGLSAFSAELTGEAGGVYPVYLSIQNPLDFRNLTDEQIKLIAKEGVERYALDAETIEKNIREAIMYNNDQLVKFYAIPVIEKLADYGYDGIIADMGIGGKEYAVVNPNQIKSVFNNGEYSLDNDSILFDTNNKEIDLTEEYGLIKGGKITSDDVRNYIQSLVNDIYETATKPLQIKITGRNKAHIIKSSKHLKGTNKARHEAALVQLDKIIESARKTEREGTLNVEHNSKRTAEKKLKIVEEYVYFENALRIGDNRFDVELATERVKGQDPNILDLYNVWVKSRENPAAMQKRTSQTGVNYNVPYSDIEVNPDDTLAQSAYHGTSANFDRFLNEFIGSGEGAQAFGYGHYVSGSDKIGKIYAKQDQRRKGGMFRDSNYVTMAINANKMKLEEINHILPLLEQIPDSVEGRDLYDRTVKIVKNEEKKDKINPILFVHNHLFGTQFQTKDQLISFLKQSQKETEEELERLKNNFGVNVKRHLYKVEIPDENDGIHSYLDWNELLGENLLDLVIDTLEERYSESKAVKADIKKFFPNTRLFNGADFYEQLSMLFEYIDDAYLQEGKMSPFGEEDNYQKIASEFLSELGFTGIKYRAGQVGGAPRGAENAYNYVIFNPDDLVITNHWTYETDEEADAFFQLSAQKLAEFQTRRAELIQPYKDQIQRAIEVNEYVADEYIEYFKDEQWAADELLLRSILKKHPESAAEARKYDSADEWIATMENVPDHLIPRYRRIYDLAHMMTPEQEDRIFLLNWTSSDASVLKLANLLRSYRTKASERQQRATGNTVTGQFGAYKGVSTKLLRLRDRNGVTSSGREYERSTHEEIDEVRKLIQANPRAYREAYLKAYGANDYAYHDQMYFDYGVENLNYRLDQLFGKIDAEQAKAEHRQDLIDSGNTAQLTIEDLQERIDRANEDLKDLKVESGATIRELKEKLEKVDRDYKSAEYWRRENARKLDEARKQNTQNERELKEKNERIESLNKRLSESREKANNLKVERDKAERAANALQRKVDLMEERDKRIKTMKDIVKMMKFNFDTVDASFEDMFAWVRNLFDYDKEERDALYARRRELLRMLDAESIDTGTREKIQAELEEVRQEINASELVEIPEGLRVYFATEIGNDTGYIFDKMMYRDNRQSKWSQEELDFILNRVQIMKQDAQAMLESKKLARSSRLSQEAAAFFRQTYNQEVQSFIKEDVTQFKAYDDIHSDLYENIRWIWKVANATPGRLARQIDGNREGVAYNRFIRKAWNAMFQETENKNRRLEQGKRKYKELGLSASKLNKKGYTYTKDNGTQVDLTRGQMVGVYVYAQSDPGIQKISSSWGNGIQPEDVQKIVSSLTPAEKAWGDFLLYEMGSQYSRIAEVFYRVYNKNLGKRDAYFPLVAAGRIVEGSGDILAGPQANAVRYTDKGFTKSINPYAIYELNLNVTDTWIQQVQRQEHFMAYAEWARDTNYLLGRGGLADIIKQKFGEDIVKNLQHYTNFVGSPQTNLTKTEKIINSLASSYGASRVIGNMSAMLKQLPTMGAALRGDTDAKNFLKAVVAPKVALEAFIQANNLLDPDSEGYEHWKNFIYDNDPQMKNRRLGGTFIGDLTDTSASKFGSVRNQIIDEVSKYTLSLTDGFVTQRLWLAAYMTTFEKLKDTMSTEEAHNEARFQASRLISETQNTSLRMDLNQNLRQAAEGKGLYKLVFMFGSATMNIFNQMFYDIPYFINSKQGKRAVGTILNILLNMASMMAISGALFRKKDEDDEEYWKRIALEVLKQNITTTIPGWANSFISAYDGYGSGISMSLFEDFGTTVKKYTSGKLWEALLDSAILIAGANKLPANAIEKISNSIINLNPGYLMNKSWADWYEENVK